MSIFAKPEQKIEKKKVSYRQLKKNVFECESNENKEECKKRFSEIGIELDD